ncbi:retinol dehydrogenase 12-like [Euwallacea fornicatus]|uniref:retinol dehydrogenase 12-like n=1 Tax=Euwallacea fornicatus TaxID=995702 RepID=UPI00338F7008
MAYGYPYYYIYFKYATLAVIAASLPVIALVALKLIQKYTIGRCRSMVCLVGKTVLVTGSSSGLGFQTALVLASRGARVIITDKVDGANAKRKIIEKTHNTNIVTKYLDLASLDSVRKFAKDINETEERLDILINNAGVGALGDVYTKDGLHPTMQINHFGPFLLTHLLTDLLKKSAPSRIIFVSSAMAFLTNLTVDNLNYSKDQSKSYYHATCIYGNSKLCNVITANGFAEKLKDSGVTSNSLHPGLVNTNIYMKSARFLELETFTRVFRSLVLFFYGKTIEEGVQTIIHLALCNKVKEVTGKYFWDCRLFPSPPGTWNKKFTNAIWEKSEELVGLTAEEKLKKD